jgi:hypothetical protein
MRLGRCRDVLPWSHGASKSSSREAGLSGVPHTLEHSPAPASIFFASIANPLNSVHLSGVVTKVSEADVDLSGEKIWGFTVEFHAPAESESPREKSHGREDIEVTDQILEEGGGGLVPGVEVLVAGHLRAGGGIRATQLVVGLLRPRPN